LIVRPFYCDSWDWRML